mmetsp:Transcript_47410/g.88287  ORF Transcript_47410/g.88287 Transcript_47410/m.88287 type:complete len:690 (-) Transcript_47410:69-2138(-)
MAPVRDACALAERAECKLEMAQAALSHVDAGDVQAAFHLLKEGPKEAYIGMAEAGNEKHGDSVFQHPYIRCLLDVARSQVRKSLENQRCKDEEKWLICVRTYGRAGEQQSELERFLIAVLDHKNRVAATKEKLAKLEIHDVSALKMLWENPSEVKQRLKKFNMTYFPKKMLQKLEENVNKPLEQIERKRNRRHFGAKVEGVGDLTLAALEKALGPKAHERCLIFVSHEDPAFKRGDYTTALAGTPWSDRIVQGVKGAHLQVRFMEEAAPKGTHIVVMDDNIRELVVEECDAEVRERRKAETMHWGRKELVYGDVVEHALKTTGLAVVEESELHRFLRAAWPQKKVPEIGQLESSLRQARVTTLSGLRQKIATDSVTKDLLGIRALQARTMDVLKMQLRKPLPPPMMLARPSTKPSPLVGGKAELAQLITRAGKEMTRQSVSLWGVSPTQNHFFLAGAGDSVRLQAKKYGIFKEYSSKLGLVYGACFGFRALHDRLLYTRFGQVKDDVERTLRYWHYAGGILRFSRYAAHKAHKPGQFSAKKGGISAASSAERHAAEGNKAIQGLMDEFASLYVRFPKPGEKTSCGLIWKADDADGDGAEQETLGKDRTDATDADGTPVAPTKTAASQDADGHDYFVEMARRARAVRLHNLNSAKTKECDADAFKMPKAEVAKRKRLPASPLMQKRQKQS